MESVSLSYLVKKLFIRLNIVNNKGMEGVTPLPCQEHYN